MSAYSHMSDNDPEVLEKEKKKSLSKKDKEWNEKLASQSEAAVSICDHTDIMHGYTHFETYDTGQS